MGDRSSSMNRSTRSANPETIWHYTNWAGLNGILSSGKLWASHISYLNDTAELKHAAKLFQRLISERIKNALVANLQFDAKETVDSLSELNVCVVSFSGKSDDLSQWRGYASPPPGFALGFDFGKLQAVAAQQKCRLVACEYDEKAQTAKLGDIVDAFKSAAYGHWLDLKPDPKKQGVADKNAPWSGVEHLTELAPGGYNATVSREEERPARSHSMRRINE